MVIGEPLTVKPVGTVIATLVTLPVPTEGLFRISAHSIEASITPFVPLNTSPVLVASGINVNLPVERSKPKKPTLAAVPLCQRYSTPRSLPSSLAGAVSPPSVIIGSSSVTVVELTVVVVPFTVKLPVTTSDAAVAAPIVVMLLLPAHVESAVFSTLANPTLDFAKLVIHAGSA